MQLIETEEDSESCRCQDVECTRKDYQLERRGKVAPLLLAPWVSIPFPSPSFSFSFHLLHLSCRLQKLGLRMLITHFCLGNYAQSPTSQQRVEQWFLTIFESQAPWRPLNSARCYTLLWSPSTNPEQQPRWGTSKWQVRRWTRFCSFLFSSTLLLRAVLGPLPLLLKMSENRPTDKEWRYQRGNLKNKTNGKLLCVKWASQVAWVVKNSPTTQETQKMPNTNWSLGQEDPLEGGMATHSSDSCLENPMDREAWRAIVHKVTVGHDWSNLAFTHTCIK